MDLAQILLLFGTSTQWRRAKALKNILTGRRTVSNLYLALQYGLLPYFGALHGLLTGEVPQAVSDLNQAGLIETDSEWQIRLTKSGDQKRNALLRSLPSLSWLAEAADADVCRFEKRFNFAVQVVSEYSYANNRYYPQNIGVFDSQLIKKWFIQNKHRHLPNDLKALLTSFLTAVNQETFAEIFVQGLSGHQVSGQTDTQIAEKYDLSETIVSLIRLMLYAHLLHELTVTAETEVQPLIQGLSKPAIATSAQKTFALFCRFPELTLHEIAQKRQLKLTTVYEHLLEAAIVLPVDEVPFHRLLKPSKARQLTEAAFEKRGEWSFQTANQKIPDLTFFEYRLFQIKQLKVATPID